MRALLLEPTVLLLDEPTAALDPDTERAAERLVLDWLAGRGGRSAFLWVSHRPEQAERLSSKSWWIEGGRLTEPTGRTPPGTPDRPA